VKFATWPCKMILCEPKVLESVKKNTNSKVKFATWTSQTILCE
jgi:hypothetical protein